MYYVSVDNKKSGREHKERRVRYMKVKAKITRNVTTVSKAEKEAMEFIEILKTLSRDEKNQVKGYMTCLKTIRNIKTA